jgi:hypothetical protein
MLFTRFGLDAATVIGCTAPWSLFPSSGRFGPDARNGPAPPSFGRPHVRAGVRLFVATASRNTLPPAIVETDHLVRD